MVKRALILLFALVALPLGVTSLLGIRPFVLRSDSMEPDYRSGDLVFADTGVAFDSLKEGDVIVYQGSVQELTRYRGTFQIQADRSSAAAEIAPSQLVGRVVLSIPRIGNLIEVFLGHRDLAWLLTACIFVCALLPRRLLSRLFPGTSMKKEGEPL